MVVRGLEGGEFANGPASPWIECVGTANKPAPALLPEPIRSDCEERLGRRVPLESVPSWIDFLRYPLEPDQKNIIYRAALEWFNAIFVGAVRRASGRIGASGAPTQLPIMSIM